MLEILLMHAGKPRLLKLHRTPVYINFDNQWVNRTFSTSSVASNETIESDIQSIEEKQ
jgi:hypothetical protein